MTKRWWVIAEQLFPAAPHRYDGLYVVHRICFKRSEFSDTGLHKNKFMVDFAKFDYWRNLLHRDDFYASQMWPRHLKHQKLIQNWLTIS